MLKKPLYYLVMSDIHFGHKINKTEYIVESLDNIILKIKNNIHKLNMVFINGDVFDRLLSNKSTSYTIAIKWLTRFINLLYKHNIKLRILEGTSSHDWKQSSILYTIISNLEIDIDFKYIDTLYIEHIDEYNINILYIPDEWNDNANDTYIEVLELLKEHKLDKVDLTMMHGAFNYQLPIQLDSNHNEKDYLDITKYYIHAGHIHKFSIYDRIIANGSVDRLAHNEEENKGILLSYIDNDISKFEFVKNDHAMIYKTIKTDVNNIEDIKPLILNILNNATDLQKNKPINIQLDISDDNPLNKEIKTLESIYGNINFKVKSKSKRNKLEKVILNRLDIEVIEIRPDNIEELLLNELKDLNKEEINIFKKELYNAI